METGETARGQSIFESGGSSPAAANVELIRSMDMGGLMKMLRESVRTVEGPSGLEQII